MIVALSGVLKVPLPVFLLLVAIAKTGRYMALGWLGAAAFGGEFG
jgi:membrane protein YqaA with SNARE-associated domain